MAGGIGEADVILATRPKGGSWCGGDERLFKQPLGEQISSATGGHIREHIKSATWNAAGYSQTLQARDQQFPGENEAWPQSYRYHPAARAVQFPSFAAIM